MLYCSIASRWLNVFSQDWYLQLMLMLLYDSQSPIVSGVRLWTVTGPYLWRKELESFALLQLDCVKCKMHRLVYDSINRLFRCKVTHMSNISTHYVKYTTKCTLPCVFNATWSQTSGGSRGFVGFRRTPPSYPPKTTNPKTNVMKW